MRRGGGLIGPFFFVDGCGKAHAINSERYVETALKGNYPRFHFLVLNISNFTSRTVQVSHVPDSSNTRSG